MDFFLFTIHSDDTWYITNDIDAEEGDLKSGQKDEVFVPDLGWKFLDHSYFDNDFDNCKTVRSYRKIKRKKTYLIDFFSGSACVFPFTYFWGELHYKCITIPHDYLSERV